jgi:hypothetical protein
VSSYVHETRQPERECCPFHSLKFKKKGRYWHCPKYAECGYSIGSRPLVGQVTRMWVRQSKRGKAWVRAHHDSIRACTEVLESSTAAFPPPPEPPGLMGVMP